MRGKNERERNTVSGTCIRKNEMATDTFLMYHSLSKPAGNHFSTVTIYAYYTYTHTHTHKVGG